MKVLLRLFSFFLSIFLSVAAEADYTLLHEGCFLDILGSLICRSNNLHLPGNFSITQLQALQADPIKVISLSCPDPNGPYCNFISKDVESFPSIPALKSVELFAFQTDEGHMLPVDQLLKNNKDHLERLLLYNCKIDKLDSRFMRGFERLEYLEIRSGNISGIAVDTFEHAASNLEVLYLPSNALTTFDWGVIKPLAGSLKRLTLFGQNPPLQSLYCSTAAFHVKLESLSLNGNQLSTIPKEILNTLVVETGKFLELDFGGNPICQEKPDCSCCTMKSIAQWYAQVANPKNVEIIGRCGPHWRLYIVDPIPQTTTSNDTENAELFHIRPLSPSAYASCINNHDV